MRKQTSRPLPSREGVGGGIARRDAAGSLSFRISTSAEGTESNNVTAARLKFGLAAVLLIATWLLVILGAAILTQVHAGETVSINGLRGDATRGETIYRKCQGCHSIDRNRVGPMHQGLFGRQAGTVSGFDYSKAMRNSGIVWNEQTLDSFLADPRAVVPGTKMTYAGIKNPQDRADLIAYLKEATRD